MEFMKIQIRVVLPGGDDITIPVDNNEIFKDFQTKILQMHGLSLEKEYFNLENNIIHEDESIASFLNKFSYSNLEEQTDITYEIRLQNDELRLQTDEIRLRNDEIRLQNDEIRLENDEIRLENDEIRLQTDEIPLQNETRIQNDETLKNDSKTRYILQDGQMETNESYITLKEVENFAPLINLNTDNENNRVLNVLSDTIFENEPYIIMNSKENNTVQFMEETNNQLVNENAVSNGINELNIVNLENIAENNVDTRATLNDQQIYNYMDIESKLREIHDSTEELVTDLCRLCARNLKNDDKVLIYGDDDTYDEKINHFLPINVGVNDGLPHQMCSDCLTQLKNFSDFYQTVQQADKVLRLKFMNSEATEMDNNKETYNTEDSQNSTLNIILGEPQERDEIKCRFCQVVITDLNMSITHSINSHSNISGLNICILCDFGFTSLNLLKEHVYTIHKNTFAHQKLFQCKICSRTFNSQLQLQTHACIKEKNNQMMLHCETCNQVYPTKMRLNFHRQFHLKHKRSLYCYECKLNFNDENDHFNHVNCFHNLKQIFTCDICDKTFVSLNVLNSHKEVHSNEFKCDICQKTCLNYEALNEHQLTHTDVKPSGCDICGKNFIRSSRLKKHLLTHELNPLVKNVYVCSICNQCFSKEDDGKVHEDNKHIAVDCIDIVKTDKIFRCEFCEECYITIESLKTHKYLHKERDSYSCQICKAHFSSLSRCTTHQTTHATDIDINENNDFLVPKHLLCEYCGRSYPQWNYLNHHRRLKHPGHFDLYKCSDCNGEFSTVSNFNLHRKNVHSNDLIKCDDCGKYLANLKLLQTHKITQHSDKKEKDLKCEKCNKVFAYQVTLDSHMKTHVKEFKCNYCRKSFINNIGLVSHLKTHRESNKNCGFCGKKFQTIYECTVHEKTHKKQHYCEICDKEFLTKTQLIEHSKIHTNMNRLFHCDICGLYFKKSSTFRNHKSRHYKEKNPGSFVLMVDMNDDVQEKNNLLNVQNVKIESTESNINNNPLTIQNSYINLDLNNSLSDNYIDIGNGQYLKVQGNSVNIDGKDYLLIDQNGKTVDQTEEFQMVVDDNYVDNNVTAPVENLDSTVMLVDSQNQIILNENQINQPEYVFTTDDTIGKPGTTYVIEGDQIFWGSDDQVTF